VKILAAELAASVADPAGAPAQGLPEIAFLGRSNVGKSSLLNRLMARRQLARTSQTPGKTRLLHFYRVDRGDRGSCLLVDLPGYGWARVSRRERGRWRRMVEGYLQGRRPLRAVVLLHDLRRDPGPDEVDLLAWLDQRQIPALVALTKLDKLKAGPRARRVAALGGCLPVQADWIVPTSARTGAGVERLWELLDRLL